jgi:4-hydroxy-3-methylbut-2-enyl diphosphate reductase
MGVRRAVDMVLDLQRSDTPLPISTYGPLIHNPQTLELLRSRGIQEAKSLAELPRGTVVVRAHGISPLERGVLENKGVKIVDATCPRVAQVQTVIRKHATQGHFCIIVGDEDHPEVRGLMGFASGGGLVVSSVEKCSVCDSIPPEIEICVVAQTTQEIETFENVVELLKNRFPRIHVHNTICDSTRKRQSEVGRLAGEVDTIVVVGGKGSGNTRRLVKVAKSKGVKALHVETGKDIQSELVAASDVIGVTAGASTPNWQIREVMDRLKEISINHRVGPLKSLRRVADIAIMTYCVAGLAGAGITAACLALQGRQVTCLPLAVTMLFVFSMHLINRIQERSGAVRFNTPEVAAFYARHRPVLTTLAALASLAAIIFSYMVSLNSCLLLTAMLLTGSLYTLPLFSQSTVPRVRWRSLKDLPGSKTPLVALGWGVCASVLPIMESHQNLSVPALVVSFCFAAGTVFWRTALSDLLDLQGDRIMGRETIPILIGVKRTGRLLQGLLISIALLLGVAATAGVVSTMGFWLIPLTLIFGIFYTVYRKRPLVDRLLFEGMLDINLFIAGAISVIYSWR